MSEGVIYYFILLVIQIFQIHFFSFIKNLKCYHCNTLKINLIPKCINNPFFLLPRLLIIKTSHNHDLFSDKENLVKFMKTLYRAYQYKQNYFVICIQNALKCNKS